MSCQGLNPNGSSDQLDLASCCTKIFSLIKTKATAQGFHSWSSVGIMLNTLVKLVDARVSPDLLAPECVISFLTQDNIQKNLKHVLSNANVKSDIICFAAWHINKGLQVRGMYPNVDHMFSCLHLARRVQPLTPPF